MNTIFKVIWSHSTQSFVVTSELTKEITKSSSHSSVSVLNRTRIGIALSLGLCSNVVMANPPVIGTGNTCVVDGITIACADGAKAVTAGSIAIGERAIAGMADTGGMSNQKSIAIGSNAQAKAQDSIAQGTGAIAHDDKAIAIGNDAVAGHNGPALGWWKYLTNPETNALFQSQQELEDYLAKVGDNKEDVIYKQMHGFESIAVGNSARSIGSRTVAIGRGAEATIRAWNSVVIGDKASSNGPDAVIIGREANGNINSRDSVAIGTGSRILNFGSVAIGSQAVGGSIFSTAVGAQSSANEIGAASFGAFARADAWYSNALGSQSRTLAYSSVALVKVLLQIVLVLLSRMIQVKKICLRQYLILF
ncbi:hypothetical protein L5B71_01970 [Avibacterium sp. 21-586]|uniref:ESPR-type extended signal peptide-containing protein n=1 Tax=Avibacterium sp. 21-586 TaxID=2911534 RepID=UPI002245F7F8|nr:ESPR-type extended signal peptide-containing protein [Avibacterium sp. 21-586]MCW9709657.1 hypothetical protein [Avibacterium sp. 21-586]